MVRVLEPEEIIVSSRFSGSVEPLQSTELAFKLPGTVRRLYRPPGLDRDVQVGDTLAKGTVIAEYDEGDLRRAKAGTEARVAQLDARVATAKTNLEIATRNYERYANSAGSVSQAARDDADARRVTASGELATAEYALADARVQLDQANDDYANRQLVVPFDHATVAEKHIEPGERKAAHELAFRLIDISTVHVNIGVPDTTIGKPALETEAVQRVFLGQTLPVTADAFEGPHPHGERHQDRAGSGCQDADVPHAVDPQERGSRARPGAAAAGHDRFRPRWRTARPQGHALANGRHPPRQVPRRVDGLRARD
jgi:multidrug efflux pump subunit AcrA (membrane-fusion protein)